MLPLLLLLCPTVMAGRMETLYSWKFVDFVFPSEAIRDVYISNGEFIPKNNLIIDVDEWLSHAGRNLFVTMPKSKPGTPVTLAKVSNLRRNGTTLLQPYPDWSWHQGNCDGLISVFRTHVDRCDRLWVMDSGVVDIFDNFERKCQPKIVIFNLQTDSFIKSYEIPDSVLDHDSLLINIAVDTRTSDCSDTFAYLADVTAFKLIVYDSAQEKSWRVASNYFYPYPLAGDFHIAGKHFNLMDGIFGLALGPLRTNGDRTLYFHSLASVRESWVSTSVLRNASLFSEDPGAAHRSFHVFETTRNSQSAAEDMSQTGVLLYSLVEDNAIGCWNSHLPYRKQNFDIIAKDDDTLQFQSGLKVYGNLVWSLSSRFQNFFLDEVPDNEINYRINVGRLSDLLRHTKCDHRISGGSPSSLQLSFSSP